MASATITVRFAWWLPLYLSGLKLTCWTMGTEPDWDKVAHVVWKAMRLRWG